MVFSPTFSNLFGFFLYLFLIIDRIFIYYLLQ
jgi:hypothetical protein